MKERQQIEILTLDRIIQDSLSLSSWDGIHDGVRGGYADDKVKYVEWNTSRIDPELIYFKINGAWKWGYITGNINEKIRINKLLKAKERYDLSMTTWIADIQEWLLSIQELRAEWWNREADIIQEKLFNPYRELNDIEKAILNNKKATKTRPWIFHRIWNWIKNIFSYIKS